MRNRIGFATRKGYPEPVFYSLIFNAWNAVYFTGQDEEYHLVIDLDAAWAWQTGYTHGKSVSILKQCPTCRTQIAGPFKSIKAGLEQIRRIIDS